MSQITNVFDGSVLADVETLTGNSGGPVGPSAGNIDIVGDGITIDVVGDPGTNTLTISAIEDTDDIETLTGNSGGAVGPTLGNVIIIGDGTTIDVVGNPGTSTLTISAIEDTDDIETITGNSGGPVGPTLGDVVFVGDGTTIDITGNPGTSTLTASLTGGTDGQVPIAATAGVPTWASITAGQNITITPGANTLDIAASEAQILTEYRVANASPFVVNSTDFYITVDTTTIPITIQLPDAPTTYRRFIIKDSGGMAATNNISVTTVSGVLNIDAATTFTMNSNYQAIELMYSGFGYEVF